MEARAVLNNYFSISEFLIDPDMREERTPVPLHVIDKIWGYHLPILNDIRHRLDSAIFISQHSGYRPVEWEKQHGRDGTSQHCYKSKGAVDVTCKQMRLDELQAMLLESDYNRVTWYNDDLFFHCDFKGDQKLFFESDSSSNWKLIENVR